VVAYRKRIKLIDWRKEETVKPDLFQLPWKEAELMKPNQSRMRHTSKLKGFTV
jgi:hypothetical protein